MSGLEILVSVDSCDPTLSDLEIPVSVDTDCSDCSPEPLNGFNGRRYFPCNGDGGG